MAVLEIIKVGSFFRPIHVIYIYVDVTLVGLRTIIRDCLLTFGLVTMESTAAERRPLL